MNSSLRSTKQQQIMEKCIEIKKILSCPERVKKYVNDLNQHLKNNKQSVFSQSNVNEAFDNFNTLFLEMTKVYSPITISKTKSKSPQWFCNN